MLLHRYSTSACSTADGRASSCAAAAPAGTNSAATSVCIRRRRFLRPCPAQHATVRAAMTVTVSPPTARERTMLPWYLWAAAAAVTSAYIGGYWDISWHRSIGRDTFWSPPHMAIYACGVLAGLSAAYLIFAATFGRNSPLNTVSVNIWGFRGPLGAFICAWGG